MFRNKMCLEILLNMEKIFNTYTGYSQIQRKYSEEGNIFFEKEVHLLKQIIENPNDTITLIAEKTSRTKSSVSQVVKRLIEKNLITIKKDNVDKRKVIFLPTEKGKKLYYDHEYYDNKMAELLSIFFTEYSDEEIKKFLEMLIKYLSYMHQGYSLKDI